MVCWSDGAVRCAGQVCCGRLWLVCLKGAAAGDGTPIMGERAREGEHRRGDKASDGGAGGKQRAGRGLRKASGYGDLFIPTPSNQ